MAKLKIGDQIVEVSDEFAGLSPDQQQAIVQQIASQLQVQKLPEGGNILNPVSQGVSFGFADELSGLAGAGVNSIMNLFGKGTGDSFGTAYRDIRDSVRRDNEAFRTRNPKTALAAEIGGGLLTGGMGAARSGAAAGANSLLRMGAQGAAAGGLYGAGASDADLTQGDVGGLLADTAKGAAIGGAGGVLLPAAGRQVGNLLRRVAGGADDAARAATGAQASASAATGPQAATARVGGLMDDVTNIGSQSVDDVANATRSAASNYADDVARLRSAGIDLTTGQRTGSNTIKAYETTLRPTTGGGVLDRTFSRQREQFQNELLRMAGASDDIVRNSGGRITSDTIDDLGQHLSRQYQSALKGKTVNLGDDFVDALASVEGRHSQFVTSQQRREIRTLIDDFLNEATGDGISGQRYQQLRSLMGRRQRQNAGSNPPLADLFGDLKNALDDAFTSSVGANNRTLNQQYAHYRQLEQVWRRGGGTSVAQGELPLASLNSLAKKSPGSQDWRRFVNAASAVLGDVTPNSGTASRMSLLRTLGNVGSLGTLELGLLGGRAAASGALASGMGANAIPATQRALQATGQGITNAGNVAGLLSGPVSVAAFPGLLAQPPLPEQ